MKELALHIMDIMQNSLAADSSQVAVGITTCDQDSILKISIEDDGCGMDSEMVKASMDPFATSRKTRSVGLGIPMLKEAATLAQGEFNIMSELGEGTQLIATFKNKSIDRQPLGDLGNVFFLNILSHEDVVFSLHLSSSKGNFAFNSKEFYNLHHDGDKGIMDIAFDAEEYINANVKNIFDKILPEMGGGIFES